MPLNLPPDRMPFQVYSGNRRIVVHPVDIEPYYTFGRQAESVSIALEHHSCSRVHAALVHHNDGRIFLIDLQSVSAAGGACPELRSLGTPLGQPRPGQPHPRPPPNHLPPHIAATKVCVLPCDASLPTHCLLTQHPILPDGLPPSQPHLRHKARLLTAAASHPTSR